jgi:protein-S-isoprenylcysteine O-methyltransferase Ste14
MKLADLGEWAQRHRVRFGQLFAVAYLLFAHPTVPSAVCGSVLLLAGAAVRTWAAGNIRKREVLAVTGPYAHTRNPLYFGSFLMAVGALVMGANPWIAAVALLFAVPVYGAVIRREETLLAGKFGEEFAAYTVAVPRFFPRLAVPPGSGGGFDWGLVRRNGEWRAWIVVVALPLLFALLLRTPHLPLVRFLADRVLSR